MKFLVIPMIREVNFQVMVVLSGQCGFDIGGNVIGDDGWIILPNTQFQHGIIVLLGDGILIQISYHIANAIL